MNQDVPFAGNTLRPNSELQRVRKESAPTCSEKKESAPNCSGAFFAKCERAIPLPRTVGFLRTPAASIWLNVCRVCRLDEQNCPRASARWFGDTAHPILRYP